MQYFKSVDDYFCMETNERWEKEPTARGFIMRPSREYGAGTLEYMGDFPFYFWTVADYIFHKNYVCGNTLGERYIEIAENLGDSEQSIVHYQKKNEPHPVEPGLNCFVNFEKWTLFSSAPAGIRLVFTSLLIRESFFEEYGITLPDDFWERAPQVLNPDVLYIPEISSVLRQVAGKLESQPEALPIYLKAKAVETAALLIDYVYSRKSVAVRAISEDTRKKVSAARKILNENLKQPPIVMHLAELVGLNKNALQQAFRHCTGHSVGEYLRACRMEKALTMLKETELSIADIARHSGYQSPANFYHAFEKTFSMPPGEMRKLMLEENMVYSVDLKY